MRFVICDDEEQWRLLLRDTLCDYLRRSVFFQQLQPGQPPDIHCCASIEQLYKLQQPDVLLLDVDLADGRGDSGMAATKQLRKRWPQTVLLFATSHAEYAPYGYPMGAKGYVLKSDLSKMLTAAMDAVLPELVVQQVQTAAEIPKLQLSSSCQEREIAVNRILSIHHAHKRFVIRLYSNAEPEKIRDFYGTLDTHTVLLRSYGFLQVGKNNFYNWLYIVDVHRDKVVLANGEVVKFSPRRSNEVWAIWKKRKVLFPWIS